MNRPGRLVAEHARLTAAGYAAHLRAYFGILLLIVGVMYPEAKTTIGGLHWPPLVALVGVVLILVMKPRPLQGLMTGAAFVGLLLALLGTSYALALLGVHDHPAESFVLQHFSTLAVTTSIAFLLVCDIETGIALACIHRFMYALAVALLAVRLAQADFSREGTFLGLGPLTFAKYVCCGWIAQVVRDGRVTLMSSTVYLGALLVSASKGPLLFIMVTLLIWVVITNRRRLLETAIAALCIVALMLQSGRFQAFTADLTAIQSEGLVVPDLDVISTQLREESMSSTFARVISVEISKEYIQERPILGWGLGSWPERTGLEVLEYPHNSVVQIWFELGAIGLATFVIFVGVPALGVRRGNPFSLFVIFCGLLSLTTGSFRDLRLLLFFALLAWNLRDTDLRPARTRGARHPRLGAEHGGAR